MKKRVKQLQSHLQSKVAKGNQRRYSQYDRLTGMGLDVPQASVLSHRLKRQGLDIGDCYQLSCLADKLEKLLKGGENHA